MDEEEVGRRVRERMDWVVEFGVCRGEVLDVVLEIFMWNFGYFVIGFIMWVYVFFDMRCVYY